MRAAVVIRRGWRTGSKSRLGTRVTGLLLVTVTVAFLWSGLFLERDSDGQIVNLPTVLHFSCGFKQFTGFPCPGCGLTRAMIDLLHGNFARSFQTNPAGLPVIIFFISSGWLGISIARGVGPSALAVRLHLFLVVGMFGVLLLGWWRRVIT